MAKQKPALSLVKADSAEAIVALFKKLTGKEPTEAEITRLRERIKTKRLNVRA